MLQLAICDDNMDELSLMVSLIEEYRTANYVEYEYAVFHNGFDLLHVLERGGRFQIYCLDIIMPGFSGMELAKEIRSYDKNAQIIFFTTSPEFALESYTVKAINYVLKPVTREKLHFVLGDVLERIEKNQEVSVVVKSRDGLQRILLSNLVFAEVIGKKVYFHLVSGRVVECMQQFSTLCEELLKHGCFIKPHRSYLVNMSYIDRIGGTEIILQTLTVLPIAQGKAKEIKENYLAFQMEEE